MLPAKLLGSILNFVDFVLFENSQLKCEGQCWAHPDYSQILYHYTTKVISRDVMAQSSYDGSETIPLYLLEIMH